MEQDIKAEARDPNSAERFGVPNVAPECGGGDAATGQNEGLNGGRKRKGKVETAAQESEAEQSEYAAIAEVRPDPE
jgi:hypothetical protein